MNADRIYVLDAGHVVETGNDQTLMAANGVFATLASRQLA
jgi:ABC-type multidrug transport system fused ATPase/permease subunit